MTLPLSCRQGYIKRVKGLKNVDIIHSMQAEAEAGHREVAK